MPGGSGHPVISRFITTYVLLLGLVYVLTRGYDTGLSNEKTRRVQEDEIICCIVKCA